MVILSARFAFLACLCAALPLARPPPVEAAHIYGSHTMEKQQASSSHAQQRTRTRDGSFLGGPTATHRHDGKNNAYQAPGHRASGLPPLLRRDRVHNHNKIHNQHVQGSHDDTHHKVPRSAFARSRYRCEDVYLGRRSSVYVPGEHGDTYLVSRTLPRNWGHGKTGQDKHSSHAYDRRQVDESNLAMGRIDIMGAAQSPGNTQRLASLTADSTPVDWTSGQSSAQAFTLNASTTNQTQFIMMPTDETSNAVGSSKHVTLATEVFDASSAEMVMYCATYDPDPGATSALLMTPCTGTSQSAALADGAADPCADDENDASSSSSRGSQIFSYDPSSGRIEPISATASSSGTGDSSDDFASCAGARVRRDTGNSTTSGSVRPSSTSTSTAPTASASQQARNVTLIFVASAPEVLASSPSSSNTTITTTTSIGQASALTKTITTTVIVPVTASGSSTLIVTPAQAAASVSTVSVPSQSTTITAPSTFTTTTAARSSLSLSSSVSTTTTSSAPANAGEVEIVGVVPSTTASYSSTSTTTTTTTTTTTMTTTTTTTSSYSSSSASKNLDPLAVASSIANAMMSRRAPIFASASITR